MANTTDWRRSRVTLPQVLKEAANALLEAARLRPSPRVYPLSFFSEAAATRSNRQTDPTWHGAHRLLVKAAERARRAATRSPASDLSSWSGKALADLRLSRRALEAFPMIEIRVHVAIRTFAASRGLVAETCEWLAAVGNNADAATCQRQLLDVAERLEAHAAELRTILRIT